MIDNSKNSALKIAYTSADGSNFYTFADPLAIGSIRGISADKARRFADMKITNRSLKELFKEFKAHAAAQDLVKAFWVIQEIEFRLEFLTEEKSTLDLVCIYFMLQDEDPEIPSESMNKKKHKIFETDPKANAFFLHIGVVLMSKLLGKPEEDLHAYLAENQILSDRIRRYIPDESSINSMST